MQVSDLELLVCPDCHSSLDWHGTNLELRVQDGGLVCQDCQVEWSVQDGWVRFFREERVRRRDQLVCRVCDIFPHLHDPFLYVALPTLQGGSARDLRRVAIRHLHLDELIRRPGSPALRVLEIGMGTGAHLDEMVDCLPTDTEIWGTDLSIGLLTQARQRADGGAVTRPTRMLLSDAHHLPFPDGGFDRVLHVGGTGGFSDPAAAFREMARVARRGTPIVAVVEKLDGDRRHGLFDRMLFRAMADPHDPVAALPDGATDIRTEQVGRFYRCVSFRVPEGARLP